jgi:hypothetical protein
MNEEHDEEGIIAFDDIHPGIVSDEEWAIDELRKALNKHNEYYEYEYYEDR